MLTIYTDAHTQRSARTELYGGQLVEPFERPSRAAYVIDRVKAVGLGEIKQPEDYGMEPILRVHDEHFVKFLTTAFAL